MNYKGWVIQNSIARVKSHEKVSHDSCVTFSRKTCDLQIDSHRDTLYYDKKKKIKFSTIEAFFQKGIMKEIIILKLNTFYYDLQQLQVLNTSASAF